MSKIKLFNADCMKVMKEYPNKYFDLAIVDPPYGDFGSIQRTGGTWSNKYDRDNKIKRWDYKPDQKYFNELIRVSKNQFIWGGNYFTENLKNNRHFVIWKKHIPENFTLGVCEYMWSSMDENPKIVEYPSNREGKRFHPTQKPVQLYKWLLKNYAKPEFKLFDSHGGSMSSVIAGYDFGINEMVCCEIDAEYFEAGKARFENHKNQLQINFK